MNGTVDRVDMVFTESVTLSSYNTLDWSFPVSSELTLLDTGAAASSSTIQLAVSADSNETSHTTAPTVLYTNVAGRLTDASSNQTSTFASALSVSDAAAPVLRTDSTNAPRYEDVNGNGTIDRVRLIFTEPSTISYTDSDWSATANNLTSFDVSAVSSGNGTSTIYLTASASANLTGVGALTQPTLAFTPTTGSILDSSSNATTGISAASLSDAASPLLLATSPVNATEEVDQNASIVLTFSEAMSVSSLSYTLTGFSSPTSVSWSSGNTVATISHTTAFEKANPVSVSVDTALDPSLNAFSGALSPAVNPFSFYALRGGSDAAPAPVGVFTTFAVYDYEDFSSPITQVSTGTSVSLIWSDNGYVDSVDVYYLDPSLGRYTFIGHVENSHVFAWTVPSTSSAQLTLKISNADSITATSIWALTIISQDQESKILESDQTGTTSEAEYSLGKAGSGSSVYALFEDGTRRVFINESSFFTWENDFDELAQTDIDVSSFRLAGLMLPQHGTVLVKIQSSPKTYYLEDNTDDPYSPILRWIPSEELATQAFGPNWADYIIDIPPTFFTKFTISSVPFGLEDVMSVDVNRLKKRTELFARK